MGELFDGLVEALRLIGSGDAELREIAWRTLVVSGSATVLAMLIGVPAGYALARGSFPGRTFALASVNTGMGMPPVVIGLIVWLMLIRSGPFGGLELIYTKQAMVIAQLIIAIPLVVGFTAAAVQALPRELPELLKVLGAGRLRTLWLVAKEARLGLLAAVMAGFGAAVSEVGASLAVGGNLQGDTRVLTTAIVLETSRGQVERAIALGIVLLAMAFAVNLTLTIAQQRNRA
ncbi:MAG: ABC transporter permease [Dehalococcoidia bacterium]